MSEQQPPRIVPPEEAREAERGEIALTRGHYVALAHTAAVLGEQRKAVLALHRPWYDAAGARQEHLLTVPWDEAPAGHVCRIGGNWPTCDREEEEHAVLACVECCASSDEGERGYLFWPCPTARALGVTATTEMLPL